MERAVALGMVKRGFSALGDECTPAHIVEQSQPCARDYVTAEERRMSAVAEVVEVKQIRVHDGAGSTAGRIVFWMAVCSTGLGALYLLGLVGKLVVDGTVHSTSALPLQMVSAVIALLWDAVLLVLFVALRSQTAQERRVWAELAVVFMALMCVTSSINWFVQLAVLPRLLQGDESPLLALVDVHSPTSISFAVEHLGWGLFYGLATIFMALALGSGKLEGWIRGLFVVGGVLSLVHMVGIVADVTVIGELGYIAWGVLLPITTALLAIRFRRGGVGEV
jgi:hypothetical protein